MEHVFSALQLEDDEIASMEVKLAGLRRDAERDRDALLASLKLQQGSIKEKLDRLTDAYLDRVVDKSAYESRRAGLLLEQADLQHALRDVEANHTSMEIEVRTIFELLKTARDNYIFATSDEKRDMLRAVSSNRTVTGKDLVIALRSPYSELANRRKVRSSGPYRDVLRTLPEASMVCESRADYVFTVIRDHCERSLKTEKAEGTHERRTLH